jgi:hypothetical protein
LNTAAWSLSHIKQFKCNAQKQRIGVLRTLFRRLSAVKAGLSSCISTEESP